MNAKSQYGSAKSQVTRVNSQSVSVTFAVMKSEIAIGVCEFAGGVCERGVIGQRGGEDQKFTPRIAQGWTGKMGSVSR